MTANTLGCLPHRARDLLIRRYQRRRPDTFRSVRDLGLVPAAVCVSPQNTKSFVRVAPTMALGRPDARHLDGLATAHHFGPARAYTRELWPVGVHPVTVGPPSEERRTAAQDRRDTHSVIRGSAGDLCPCPAQCQGSIL